MVPVVGLEPTRCCHQRILSRAFERANKVKICPYKPFKVRIKAHCAGLRQLDSFVIGAEAACADGRLGREHDLTALFALKRKKDRTVVSLFDDAFLENFSFHGD